MARKEVTIQKNDAGQRLDKFLTKAYPNLPQSMLYKSIRKKDIKLNGKRCEISTRLQEGDILSMFLKEMCIRDRELTFSEDEQVVCVAENDACGIDGIQVMLGCSVGKGNLLFHLTGKQAFSVYNRETGKSVRLVLKPQPELPTKEKTMEWYNTASLDTLFDVKETTIELPEQARLFRSECCACCGEMTGEHFLRLQGGKRVCLDCWDTRCV